MSAKTFLIYAMREVGGYGVKWKIKVGSSNNTSLVNRGQVWNCVIRRAKQEIRKFQSAFLPICVAASDIHQSCEKWVSILI